MSEYYIVVNHKGSKGQPTYNIAKNVRFKHDLPTFDEMRDLCHEYEDGSVDIVTFMQRLHDQN